MKVGLLIIGSVIGVAAFTLKVIAHDELNNTTLDSMAIKKRCSGCMAYDSVNITSKQAFKRLSVELPRQGFSYVEASKKLYEFGGVGGWFKICYNRFKMTVETGGIPGITAAIIMDDVLSIITESE